MSRHDMPSATEAVDLARTILDDSEDEHPTALYALNVREARTLAHAVIELTAKVERVEALADNLDAEVDLIGEFGGGGTLTAAHSDAIRAALNGETND